jgi:protein-disulfide isomerase
MARPAARAIRCASEQDRYWDLRTSLLKSTQRLSSASIEEAAIALNLDMTPFRQCISSSRLDAAIQQDVDFGLSLNVSATPTFVVGKSGTPFAGEVLVGALPTEMFVTKIEALLRNEAIRR